MASGERTPSLDGTERLIEGASVSEAEARANAAGVDLLRPSDVADALAALPLSARTAVADIEQFSRVYEQSTTMTTTRRLYLNRFKLFLSWCAARGVSAMPAHPEVLRLYLISLAAERKTLSTLDVSLAAIRMAHRALGHDPPTSEELVDTVRSLRTTLGTCGTRSTPVSLDMLRQMVTRCGHDPHATRDRALMLVTYFAGLRRWEAAALNREGAHREERGYRLMLASTEGSCTAASIKLVLQAEPDLCPVRALDGWLVVRATWARSPDLSPTRGPLFVALHWGRRPHLHLGDRLAPGDVDRIIKRRAAAAKLKPAGMSASSLRAGFYAEAARSGASLEEVCEQDELGATPSSTRRPTYRPPPSAR